MNLPKDWGPDSSEPTPVSSWFAFCPSFFFLLLLNNNKRVKFLLMLLFQVLIRTSWMSATFHSGNPCSLRLPSFILLFRWVASSETQGQIVGARESLNGRENMARRKVKNGEKSNWGQCFTRPVPNGRRRPGFWLVPENTILNNIAACCYIIKTGVLLIAVISSFFLLYLIIFTNLLANCSALTVSSLTT